MGKPLVRATLPGGIAFNHEGGGSGKQIAMKK